MPYLISRQEALDKISLKLKQNECLVCSILKQGSKYVLNKGKYTTTVLSEYPRTWGQTMILLNEHKTSVSELTGEEWDELSQQTRKTAVTIEKVLKPLRCYISSLGATENLPNTCPHVHFNILPIYNAQDKPSDIFSWSGGVYAADSVEWEELYLKLLEHYTLVGD